MKIMMNTNVLLTVLIGAMVLVSLVQTLQLFSVTNALSSGKVAVATSAVTNAPAASSSAASGSLENLPSMVGGC